MSLSENSMPLSFCKDDPQANTPSVPWPFPPATSLASSVITLAPDSKADTVAASPDIPAPTTTTSASAVSSGCGSSTIPSADARPSSLEPAPPAGNRPSQTPPKPQPHRLPQPLAQTSCAYNSSAPPFAGRAALPLGLLTSSQPLSVSAAQAHCARRPRSRHQSEACL